MASLPSLPRPPPPALPRNVAEGIAGSLKTWRSYLAGSGDKPRSNRQVQLSPRLRTRPQSSSWIIEQVQRVEASVAVERVGRYDQKKKREKEKHLQCSFLEVILYWILLVWGEISKQLAGNFGFQEHARFHLITQKALPPSSSFFL